MEFYKEVVWEGMGRGGPALILMLPARPNVPLARCGAAMPAGEAPILFPPASPIAQLLRALWCNVG